MRTATASLLSAIQHPSGSFPIARATFRKNRIFASVPYQNNPPAWAPPGGIQPDESEGTSKVVPQASVVIDGVVYSVINNNGVVTLMKSTSATESGLSSGANKRMRPGIYYDGTNLYVFALIASGSYGAFYRWKVDKTTLGITETTSYTFTDYNVAAVHPISPTVVLCVRSRTADACITLSYFKYTTSWAELSTDARIVFPDRALTLGDNVSESAGVVFGNRVFVYVSDRHSGRVMGVYCDSLTDPSTWSDAFVAVHSDLSVFVVSNAAVDSASNKIKLSGQFDRTDELATGKVRNLVLSSKDGFVFAFEKTSLVSTNGWPLHVLYSGSYVYLTAYNVVYREGNPESATPLIVDSGGIRDYSLALGIGTAQLNLSLSSGKEQYILNENIARGATVLFEIGYKTSLGDEYISMGEYTIDNIRTEFADGRRSHVIQAVHKGISKLDSFPNPFYLEIQSRVEHATDLSDMENFYPAPRCGIHQTWVSVDFWGSDPYDKSSESIVGVSVIKDGGSSNIKTTGVHKLGVITDDIKSNQNLLEYPKVYCPIGGSVQNFYVDIYAQSRTFETGKDVDAIEARLLVEDKDGVERIVTGTLYFSGNKPPQTYYDVVAGHYPIVYSFDGSNFSPDDMIKKVILVISANNTTEFYLERLTIRNVDVVISDGFSNTGFHHMTAAETGYTKPAARLDMQGRPFVMFAVKPNGGDEFQIIGKWNVNSPATGNAFGLVCFGKDGLNYIVARFVYTSASNGKYQIVKYVNGRANVLAESATTTWANGSKMMLSYRSGVFRVYVNSGTKWDIVLEKTYDITFGALTSSLDYMHTGIYGLIDPYKVRVCGYKHYEPDNEDKNDGILVLPGYETDFANFPSSGEVVIDDSVYSYTSKFSGNAFTGNKTIGPFKGKRTQKFEIGTAVDIVFFDKSNTKYEAQDYLLGSDNGHVWEIDFSTWSVTENNALLMRSRHYCANATGNYIGGANRTYVGIGIKGVSSVENPLSHSNAAWMLVRQNTSIDLMSFAAAVGEGDASLKSMIDYVCKMSGVEAEFGDYRDYFDAPVNVDTNGIILRDNGEYSSDGFDVTFKIDQVVGPEAIVLVGTNATIKYGSSTVGGIGVRRSISGVYYAILVDDSLNNLEVSEMDTSTNPIDIRVVLHGTSATVYFGSTWAHTFFFDSASYANDVTTVKLFIKNTGATVSVKDVVLTELQKRRNAIFIEMAATGKTAISSIIQERPVEIVPLQSGAIRFTYNMYLYHKGTENTRYNLISPIKKISNIYNSMNSQALSDAIVYYENVRGFSNDTAAAEHGFSVGIISIPNIEEDEVDFIVRMILKKNTLSSDMIEIDCRPDLRVEPGDIINFGAFVSSTGTGISSGDMLVERTIFSPGKMQIFCRRFA